MAGRILIFTFMTKAALRPPSHPAADAHPAKHHGRRLSGWRPILVGMVHGLAGSAVLTLLVLTEVVRDGSRLRGMASPAAVRRWFNRRHVVDEHPDKVSPIVPTTRRFERIEVPMRLVVSIASSRFWVLLTPGSRAVRFSSAGDKPLTDEIFAAAERG